MNLADWGHRQAKALLFLTVLLAVAGAFIALGLPVSLFPQVSFPRVVVTADAGDMPAEQMVAAVTRPLEEAVNSIPGVVNVRSTTSRGASEFSINFDWHVDMAQTFLLLQSRLNQVRGDLPATAKLNVRRMEPTVFPVVAYSLTSKTLSPAALRELAMYGIRPRLSHVPGVARVDVLGGQTREALVEVNPAKLLAYHLSLPQVASALQVTNQIEAAGKFEEHYQLLLTLVDGRYRTNGQIAKTVVASYRGVPVTLGDVATVRPSVAPQWVRVTANGQDAVLFNVIQQPGGNTVAIEEAITGLLDEMKPRLPQGVEVSKYYDQAELVRESMASVRDSMLVGIVLGALVLFAFLRSTPITLIAVASVPLTVAISVLLLKAFGQGFNIMTLGGLAAAVGLIIDDAIVMVENIVHHLQSGAPSALAATRSALRDQWKPFVGSSVSSIIVFVPLAFLTGVTGAFFKSLSLTMACALIISLALAIFVIPLAVGRFVKVERAHAGPSRLSQRLASRYRRVLATLLRRPWIVAAASAVMLAGSWGLYGTLPNGFLPRMDEGTVVVDYVTPPGTSLSETDKVVRRIEDVVLKTPEVLSYSRRTGTRLSGGLTEPNQGDLLLHLKPYPRRSIDAVIEDIRARVDQAVPGARVEFAQLMEDLIGDLTAVPQPIEIKVFGDDVSQLRAVAKRIAAVIPDVPGVVDVYDGTTLAGSSLLVQVDPLLAGRYGLTTDSVKQSLQAALGGVVPTQMLDGERVVGVRVRYPEVARSDRAALSLVQIPTPTGQTVEVGRVASLVVEPGNAEVQRENVKPMVAVTARIEGQSLGGTIARIQSALAQKVPLPSGVYLEYGGLYREQQSSFVGLAIATIAAVTLVFAVQLFMFQSFAAAIAIAVLDALSTFGILAALYLTGTPFNISSMMGAVMIVGIVAENAIFLLHAVQERLAQGAELDSALVEGALSRARPIAMTTLAAVLALAPLALGLGAGAQMQQPLAVAVIGGFSLSSLLLLFVLPTLYGSLLRLAGGRQPSDAERVEVTVRAS